MKIEKDVPIPFGDIATRSFSSAFRTLKPGDSFLCSPRQKGYVYQLAGRYNIKIVTRTEGDQVRVWRTA